MRGCHRSSTITYHFSFSRIVPYNGKILLTLANCSLTDKAIINITCILYLFIKNITHPRVVMVTMVYQKAAGMDVKLVSCSFFSA